MERRQALSRDFAGRQSSAREQEGGMPTERPSPLSTKLYEKRGGWGWGEKNCSTAPQYKGEAKRLAILLSRASGLFKHSACLKHLLQDRLVAPAHGKHTKSAGKRKEQKKPQPFFPKVHCSLKEKLPLLSFPPAFHFSPKKINLRLARYVKCTACVCACVWEKRSARAVSQGGRVMNTSCVLPSSSLSPSPSLLSLLRLLLIWSPPFSTGAMIHVVPTGPHSPHTDTAQSCSPLSICPSVSVCSASPLAAGKSTCWPSRAGRVGFHPSSTQWRWLFMHNLLMTREFTSSPWSNTKMRV